MNGSVQHKGHAAMLAPRYELMHVPVREGGGVDGGRTQLVQRLAEAAHHGADIDISQTLGARKEDAPSSGLKGAARGAQPPMRGKAMQMDSLNAFHRAGVHAPGTPRPKARRLARVGRDHVHVIAVGRKLLGEVLDQNCRAVDRWEVGLGHEDEPPV